MLHLPYVMSCTQLSVGELFLWKQKTIILTSMGKVWSELKKNMEAYILCKNINSFDHNLLKISLYEKIKNRISSQERRVSMLPWISNLILNQ